jgi:hypothetical protein
VRLLLLLVIERNKVEETVVVFVTAVHFVIKATAGRQGDSMHYEVLQNYCPIIIISTTTSDAVCSGLIPIPLATSGSGNDKGGGIGVDGGGGRGGTTSCTHKNNGRSCCVSNWKICFGSIWSFNECFFYYEPAHPQQQQSILRSNNISSISSSTAAQFLRMCNANAEFDHCGSMGSSM